jgi:hypothetical protein
VADITPLDQAISANIASLFHWLNLLVFRGDGLIWSNAAMEGLLCMKNNKSSRHCRLSNDMASLAEILKDEYFSRISFRIIFRWKPMNFWVKHLTDS